MEDRGSFFKTSKTQLLTETSMDRGNGTVAPRDWSNLPIDIQSSISDCLGLIELLSFRSVCKDWRSASSTASAKIETFPNHKPWFLLYGESSQCHLYNESSKKYTIDIPELDEATGIASNQGWLLLFKAGSISFFCPFSRAKIGLPQFPHSELTDHVAAFSSPPTSQDCIVSVINRINQHKLELNVLFHGANTWTKHELNFSQEIVDTITVASYNDETFYYLDSKNGAVVFSVKDRDSQVFRLVEVKERSPSLRHLPFSRYKNYYEHSYMKKWLGLKEDVSISTCGTQEQKDGFFTLIPNESIKGPGESKNRGLKGIWIQPRFFQIPPNHSWSC